jgi:hypothetical protein
MIGPLALLARIAAPMSIVFTVSTTNVPPDVTIDRVAFYAGHITLTDVQGRSVELDGYRRIDTDDSTTLRVELNDVPPGTYDRVHFVLGVDSIDNMRGPQEGALDPMHGMYWTFAAAAASHRVSRWRIPSPLQQPSAGGVCVVDTVVDVGPDGHDRDRRWPIDVVHRPKHHVERNGSQVRCCHRRSLRGDVPWTLTDAVSSSASRL